MKHKNDLKINIENKPKKVKGDNIFKRIIIVLILILLCVFILNKAKNYINTHLDQQLSRNDVASYVYLNPDYLTRLFKYSSVSTQILLNLF